MRFIQLTDSDNPPAWVNAERITAMRRVQADRGKRAGALVTIVDW